MILGIIIIGCDNLKTRVLSAIIMIAIVVPLIILGGIPFKILAIIMSILGLKELIDLRKKESNIPIAMEIISYLFVMFLIAFGNNYYFVNYSLTYQIFIVLFLVFLLPLVLINNNDKYNIKDALYLMGSTLFLSISFNTFILVENIGLTYILYIILVTVITDTFAYVGGNLIGKHKLCPKISPNKTVEGAIVGGLVGTIIPTLFYAFVIGTNPNIFIVAVVTLVLSTIGQLGDLVFSSIKRYYKVKDFSNLIPGHGGILDRLDSLIFVVLAFVLFMNIL